MTQLGAVFFSYNLRKLMKLSVALKICVEQRLILNSSVKFKYRVRKNHGKIKYSMVLVSTGYSEATRKISSKFLGNSSYMQH